ncbi:hypothetical protein GIB67_029510 [Kingdonia uniflora]|uniref:intramembrane prenyl-peptidase Rce1 n=1 Tax=Kingdonia uniflora TaxID=39325 RepID=A0A7J7NYM6_9MAGN|nr:hypothetical protein GIB67_029510 [Kingdonia uniflora]
MLLKEETRRLHSPDLKTRKRDDSIPQFPPFSSSHQKFQFQLFPSLDMEMEMEMDSRSVSRSVAVIACASMAFLYVAILYAPTLIFRLPQPKSINSFMIQRFISAFFASFLSIFLCATLLLPIKSWEASSLLNMYGFRADHLVQNFFPCKWQAVVYPLLLTSLLYIGDFISKSLYLMSLWEEDTAITSRRFSHSIVSVALNVLAWRNYVVVSIHSYDPSTFNRRIGIQSVHDTIASLWGLQILQHYIVEPDFLQLSTFKPFFGALLSAEVQFSKSFPDCSLAMTQTLQLNYMRYYMVSNIAYNIAGPQLCYTVIFGSYASFLYIRTGHLVAPVVAHIFCNVMGLPVISSRRKGLTAIAFVAGLVGFLWFLFPATSPHMYNERTDECLCWHGYCSWN